MPSELAELILDDCRRAVGEVRFGFGSKRQVWAFEERHQADVIGLTEELARADARGFLDLAIAFHDEFAAVGNAWRIRDRIEALAGELCRRGEPDVLACISADLLDDRFAVRHWLVAALMNGPASEAFPSLERALPGAYQPADAWALLARLQTLAGEHGWRFGQETATVLANLARLSADPEQRCRALELLGRFCGPAGSACLAQAAKGDADAEVRARAAELLSQV